MKGLLTLATALLLSICGSLTYFQYATSRTNTLFHHSEGELEWLRQEYRLNDKQFARVRAKHEEYAPKCAQMCANVSELDTVLASLIQSNTAVTPELDAAIKRWAELEAECRRMMLNHIYAVSAEMPAEQAARYVSMMKSRLVRHDHNHHHSDLGK